MIEQLVSRVFATRNAAHLAHWATSSYAEHVALGEFYDGVIDGIDALIEAHQGAFGLIGKVDVVPVSSKNMDDHLAEEAKWIEQNADKITGGIRALQNLLDAITDLYLTTHYKLTKLS